MSERTLPAALKTSLIANDPYTYFHLIKFEKPNGVTSSEFISGKATDYAYITDSSINISFDDSSKTSKGVANGLQTYVANKVLKVGKRDNGSKSFKHEFTTFRYSNRNYS